MGVRSAYQQNRTASEYLQKTMCNGKGSDVIGLIDSSGKIQEIRSGLVEEVENEAIERDSLQLNIHTPKKKED